MTYAGYFIDLDGTIYQGTKQFPAGKRFIERLAASDSQYLFVTNNSTKTPAEVATQVQWQPLIIWRLCQTLSVC